MAFLWVAPWGPYMGNMLEGALPGKCLFWYFSLKEMIRFHPNLVGFILRDKRSSCISEENAVFRPVLSFLFDSISIVHVYDCFVCTFVTGKEKSRILSRSLIGLLAQLHSP